jgi:hypothetical protein
MIHELKIDPKYFDDVYLNLKKFELRKNDRDFRVGDTLYLREFKNKVYTGRSQFKKITYILDDIDFGLRKDYCILGIT